MYVYVLVYKVEIHVLCLHTSGYHLSLSHDLGDPTCALGNTITYNYGE